MKRLSQWVIAITIQAIIEFAGLGVAMGNAPDDIKEIANYVTDTNMNDGVAKVVEKFVLKTEVLV